MTHTEPAPPAFDLIPRSPAEVAKAITFIALTALSLVVSAQQSSASHDVDLGHALSIALQVLALIPVYLLAGTLVKTLVAALAALGSTALQLFVGGYHPLTLADYVALGIAVAATLGVAVVPNAPKSAIIGTLTTGSIQDEPID